MIRRGFWREVLVSLAGEAGRREREQPTDAYAYVVVRLPSEKRRALVERATELGGEVTAQWRVAKP